MRYNKIRKMDISNGPGVRVSIFMQGCSFNCKNCFNKIAWDFNYGEVFDEAIEEKILKELGSGFIAGLSLLGGEPLEPQNQLALYPFIKRVKEQYPTKTIWCYTGFVLDEKTCELTAKAKNTEVTKELISLFDVLVDGPYVEELKNIRLKFRGSENQRVIDIPKTLQKGECILYLE